VRIVSHVGRKRPTDLSTTEEIKKRVNNGRLKVVAIDQKSMPKTGSNLVTLRTR